MYAPDHRTAIFEVAYDHRNPVTLTGETNLPKARQALIQKLHALEIRVDDKINSLPDKSLGNKTWGLINVSVANLRAEPRHSAELVTQALMGMPVRILKEKNGWLLIQTPDAYIAWTNGSSVIAMTREQLNTWKKHEKIILLSTWCTALDSLGHHPVSDLVAGDVLTIKGEEDGYWLVNFPDGRTGSVEKENAARLHKKFDGFTVTDSSLTAAATNLTGIPYLWGGTSTKGMDCSGFTKTVYFLNGYILPRDASQQARTGTVVDSVKNFENLQVGDLLFFGSKQPNGAEKVVHVGMWMGHNKFIHASGDVHISSMDSLDTHFDDYNFNRYLRTKRILNANQPSGIHHLTDIYASHQK